MPSRSASPTVPPFPIHPPAGTPQSAPELAHMLGTMLYNLPDLISFKDRAHRFVRCSQSVVEQLGLGSEAEVIGTNDYDYFPAEAAAASQANERRVMETGQPTPPEVVRKVFKNGSVRWYLRSKHPWINNGTIVGVFTFHRDITELKKTQDQLHWESDLLQALLDHSPDKIYFKDLESRFLKMSRSTVEQHGHGEPQTLLGKTDYDLFAEEHARAAMADELEILRSGQPIINKVEREVYPNGRVTYCLTNKMPFRNAAGELMGTMGISKDITDIRDAELKLEQLNKKLLDVSREAGRAEVASGVLHNVGNVLNSVTVSANLVIETLARSRLPNLGKACALLQGHLAECGPFLTEDPRGKQLPEYLGNLARTLEEERGSINRELEQLRKNIEHIRDIVSMQQSFAKSRQMEGPADLNQLLDDAIRINEAGIERHGIRLERDYGPLPVVTLDSHRFLQIVVNLISNAKYALDKQEGAERRITIQSRQEGDRVQVTVCDNGCGILPEHLSRIFEHGFTTRKEGHGFGLHSAALAAAQMKGSLAVQSDGPGRGAAFTLDLPVVHGGETERHA